MIPKLLVLLMVFTGIATSQLNSGFVQQNGKIVIAVATGQKYNAIARAFVPVSIVCTFQQSTPVSVFLSCTSSSTSITRIDSSTLDLSVTSPMTGYVGDTTFGLGSVGYQFYAGGYFQVTVYGHQLNGVF